MEKEKVSFIVPAFNAAKFIAETLDSVLTQSYQNLEIIVVDDGSTDRTAETVKSFGETRIQFFQQQNSGPSAARNHGFSKSSGEFIWYLDADDQILPGAVELMVAKLNENPSFSGAIGRWSVMDELGRAISSTIRVSASGEVNFENSFASMLLRTLFQVGAAVSRREVVEKSGGWDETLWCAEDRDFYLRMLENNCRFCIVDAEVLRYRKHSSNATLNLEKVELHMKLFMEKWFGVNGRATASFLALKPYAWSFAYLYMAHQCPLESQKEERSRLLEVVKNQLEIVDPDTELLYEILWDATGSEHHAKLRSALWPKAGDVVANYCWENGRNALRNVKPGIALRWMFEILGNNPTFALKKGRHLFSR